MSESTPTLCHSAHASLAALGPLLQQKGVWTPVQTHVHIAQKTLRYTPEQKLRMAFVLLLTGVRRMVEINTTLRADAGLLAAFGLNRCAEQSVVQQTLSACSGENVEQMQQALACIFRQHSRAFAHNYQADWQILDLDVSGLVCGRKAEGACKGYFPRRGQRGRQTGRVLASRYEEIVLERIYPGNTTLLGVFQDLLAGAEEVLQLSEEQRARTLVRVDAGAGSLENVNACLDRGFAYHGKDYSNMRVDAIVKSVRVWYDDGHVSGRQVGRVEEPAPQYHRPVVRVAVRNRTRQGDWEHEVVVSTLSAQQVQALTPRQAEGSDPLARALLEYLYLYDARGGGVECAFKQDNQALGRLRRNKKRLSAQQMLACLLALAHNVLVWARGWLEPAMPGLHGYGLLRLVRDVLAVNGQLRLGPTGLRAVTLQAAHPLASRLVAALRALLDCHTLDINLGQI